MRETSILSLAVTTSLNAFYVCIDVCVCVFAFTIICLSPTIKIIHKGANPSLGYQELWANETLQIIELEIKATSAVSMTYY